REAHTAIYDAPQDRMIVFGGFNDNGDALNDTWALAFSGSGSWSQLTPSGTAPFPRYAHVAIFDSPRDRMVVFGGSALTNTGYSDVADAAALSLSGPVKWTQLTPASTPKPLEEHAAIYDP